ncbi:hypothetical protein CN217_10605 [Sinorhizobium meliloti]|uniref:hypothetical protein n=1 Tax=Rhizobium meliloti TaxID=382 RepID=UPI000FD60238|nr:hypothetical protein [Sinorhizobium meliloti]RVH12743.1 hypothetical protein CN217_10605 [Sinorhizobium meliloti]
MDNQEAWGRVAAAVGRVVAARIASRARKISPDPKPGGGGSHAPRKLTATLALENEDLSVLNGEDASQVLGEIAMVFNRMSDELKKPKERSIQDLIKKMLDDAEMAGR